MASARKIPICVLVALAPILGFGNFGYVAKYGSASVAIIDLTTNTTVGLPISVGSNPVDIAITPDGQFAYVTNESGSLSVISTSSNTVVATVTLPLTAPGGLAITPDGTKAYITNQVSTNVQVLDIATNSLGTPITGLNRPFSVAVTPDGLFAYVVNTGGDNAVRLIDTSTDMVVGLPITGFNNPHLIAILPNGEFAYVTNLGNGTVSVVDLGTNTIITTITVGTNPRGIAATADGNFVYVSNRTTSNVSKIDTSTNQVVATIAVGTSPTYFSVATSPDSRFAYVTNSESDNLSVIEVSTNTVIATISGLGSNPRGIAVAAPPPPRNLEGRQMKNDFALVYEFYNHLSWTASRFPVSGYLIYREGSRIAALDSSTLEYDDHNRERGAVTSYSVTSVDAEGDESAPLTITIQ